MLTSGHQPPGPVPCLFLMRNDSIPVLWAVLQGLITLLLHSDGTWMGGEVAVPSFPHWHISLDWVPHISGSLSDHTLLPWESCRFRVCLQTWFFPSLRMFWSLCFIIFYIVFIYMNLDLNFLRDETRTLEFVNYVWVLGSNERPYQNVSLWTS
jgi:hypothetical protein